MPLFTPDPVRQQEVLDYIGQQGGPKDAGCDLPGCFKWTDVDGDDFTTPSRNQGCCAACAIFAIMSVMEIGLKWRYRDILPSPHFDLDLSEWQLGLIFHSAGPFGLCQGIEVENLQPTLETTGTVLEREVPFPQVFWGATQMAQECLEPHILAWKRANDIPMSYPLPPGVASFRIEAGSWAQITTAQDLRVALVEGPVVTGIKAPSQVSGGTGILTDCLLDSSSEDGDANHAVAIIGYDDDIVIDPIFGQGAWLVKNSHDDSDFHWIPYHSGANQFGRCLLGKGHTSPLAFTMRPFIDAPAPDVDADSDGVPDLVDNCSTSNPAQEDYDLDGIGDACDTDLDGDGFSHPVDCDDLNPFLVGDLDSDGICADVPSATPAACAAACANLAFYWAARGVSYDETRCVYLCQTPDNCPGGDSCHKYGTSLLPGSMTGDSTPDNYVPSEWQQRCVEVNWNPQQTDSDGDGKGDRCQSEIVASDPRITFQPGSGGTGTGSCGPTCWIFNSCVPSTADVTFRAKHGYPSSVLSEGITATTISVCGCPDGTGWDQTCKDDECPEFSEDHPWNPFIKPWKPIEAPGSTYGCDQWDGVLPDSMWTPVIEIDPSFNDYTQPDQCKHRKVIYSNNYPDNFRRVRWTWTGHSTDQAQPLLGMSVVGRVAYPPAILEIIEPGDLPVSVLTGFASPSDPLDPAASFLRYPRTFTNVLDLPDHMCHGAGISLVLMEQPVVWLVDSGPWTTQLGAWVLRGDWMYGDAALFGLARDGFGPVSVSKVVASSPDGSLPRLDQASALATARLDRSLVGLEPGEGTVVFALIPSDSAASHDLWVGSISGNESAWQMCSAGLGSAVPALQSPRLVVDSGVERLVVVAEGHSLASGDPRQEPAHPVYALDLATGSWSLAGSLALPAGLTGHTVVHDPFTRSLYVIGGAVQQQAQSAVYRVDLADLRVTRLDVEVPLAARRTEAAATLAPDRRRIYLWGGRLADGSQSTDLWAFDTVLDRFDLVATGVAGARQGFVSTDSTGERVYLGGAAESSTDGSIRLVSVDVATGLAEPLVALDLAPLVPGLLRGEVRDGLTQVFPVDIPSDVVYPGEVRLVTLRAEAAGLQVRVLDSRGNLLAESRSEQNVQRVAWLGQPQERYLVQVGPGAGYPAGAAVGFELQVDQGALEETAAYQGPWSVRNMALTGETAVLVGHRGIQTVDLADPDQPAFLAKKNIPGRVQAAGLVADRACFSRTLRPRGLRCLDMTDPADLHYVGPGAFTLGMGRHLAVQGEVGYVAEGVFGVGIYHLTDPGPPDKPLLLDHLWTGGLVIHVAVHGSRLYVAHLSGAVDVFRVAASTAPELLGTIWADGPVVEIMVHGDTVHLQHLAPWHLLGCLVGLGCPRGDTVEVFEAADPALATKVGEYSATGLHWTAAVSLGDRFLVPGGRGFRVVKATGAEQGP